nr:hypothetical protein Iba_chr09cCG10460 [Ipomoea batatas]
MRENPSPIMRSGLDPQEFQADIVIPEKVQLVTHPRSLKVRDSDQPHLSNVLVERGLVKCLVRAHLGRTSTDPGLDERSSYHGETSGEHTNRGLEWRCEIILGVGLDVPFELLGLLKTIEGEYLNQLSTSLIHALLPGS